MRLAWMHRRDARAPGTRPVCVAPVRLPIYLSRCITCSQVQRRQDCGGVGGRRRHLAHRRLRATAARQRAALGPPGSEGARPAVGEGMLAERAGCGRAARAVRRAATGNGAMAWTEAPATGESRRQQRLHRPDATAPVVDSIPQWAEGLWLSMRARCPRTQAKTISGKVRS